MNLYARIARLSDALLNRAKRLPKVCLFADDPGADDADIVFFNRRKPEQPQNGDTDHASESD